MAHKDTSQTEESTPSIGIKSPLMCDFEMLDEITRQMEHKPWNRLDRGHRIKKIREWVDTLQYDDDLKKQIGSALVKAIQRKEINTNTCVTYDVESCRVTNVPALMVVEDDSETPPITRVIVRRPERKTVKRRKTKITMS